MIKKLTAFLFGTILIFSLSGCGNQDNQTSDSVNDVSSSGITDSSSKEENSSLVESENSSSGELSQLEIQLGQDGEIFTLDLLNNETAREIAKQVGTEDWNLPIYNYEGWDVMQYYDIPSRYEIPSNPEQVEIQALGEVYYSHPNRMILFYCDGQIPGEYTPVGTITDTTGLSEAVQNNPVVEGWSNKIISIRAID